MDSLINRVEQVLPKIFNVQTVEHNTKDNSLKVKSRISQLVSHKALVTYCRIVAEQLNMTSVNIVLLDWEGKYLAGAKYERGGEHEE